MPVSNGGWEKKLTAISGLLASVLVPIALGLIGHFYSNAETNSQNAITQREQDREWVQIALDILRDPETDRALKVWAVDIINSRSHVKLEESAKNAVLDGGATIPLPTDAPTTSARVAEMGTIQSEGVAAALARDLPRAIKAYDTAYGFWPVFRNVDEIRSALKDLRDSVQDDNPTEQQWKKLFDYLLRMDLRGIDAALRRQLEQETD